MCIIWLCFTVPTIFEHLAVNLLSEDGSPTHFLPAILSAVLLYALPSTQNGFARLFYCLPHPFSFLSTPACSDFSRPPLLFKIISRTKQLVYLLLDLHYLEQTTRKGFFKRKNIVTFLFFRNFAMHSHLLNSLYLLNYLK